MSYQSELIASMTRRMGMKQASAESFNEFTIRVIYSALGEWIKTATYDTTLLFDDSPEDKSNASKHHITKKVTQILDAYLSLFPEIKDYFINETRSSKDCIVEFRKHLIESGMLVSAMSNSLQYPEMKAAEVAPNLYLCRGKANKLPIIIGFGAYYLDISSEYIISIDEMFNLSQESAEEFLERYLSLIENNFRTEEYLPSGREYFNCSVSSAMYKSWSPDYPDTQYVTLYRDNMDMYGVIRKTEDGFFQTSAIPSSFVKLQDIRRLIYGLWAKEKRSPTVYVEQKGAICYVRLPSHLPKKEQDLFYLIGWPRYNYRNKTQYVIPTMLMPFVEKLLQPLNLEVEYK